MKRSPIVWMLAVVLVAGCGVQDALDSAKQDGERRGAASQFGGQLAPVGDAPKPPPPPPPPKAPADESPADVASQPPPPPPPPAPKAQQKAATPGVTGKGQGYRPGPITTPIAVYFSTRERVIFNIQIPHAMNAFRAINGHFPKTEEEFMQKVIKENSIR